MFDIPIHHGFSAFYSSISEPFTPEATVPGHFYSMVKCRIVDLKFSHVAVSNEITSECLSCVRLYHETLSFHSSENAVTIMQY